MPINVGAEFPNLQEYYADDCGIVGISRENFAGMTKITFIDLDYNQITFLTQDMFVGLTTLKRIDFGKY